MSPETKERALNGLFSGLRLGTPALLALILQQLYAISQKLDLALQILAAGR